MKNIAPFLPLILLRKILYVLVISRYPSNHTTMVHYSVFYCMYCKLVRVNQWNSLSIVSPARLIVQDIFYGK